MIALKTLIFTVFVPGTATILIPYLLLSSGVELNSLNLGAPRFFGLFPIVSGALIYFWCAWDFTFAGKGTPAPIDPPQKLVIRGLYRFVRNPMYVGAFLTLIGEAWLFESATLILYALIILSGFHLFVVFYEEPTLKRKFGESYNQYCNAVPRWIPKLNSIKERQN